MSTNTIVKISITALFAVNIIIWAFVFKDSEPSGVDSASIVNSTELQSEVKIGNQVWMTKNLDLDRFSNGDLIKEVRSAAEWVEALKNEQPAFCYYNDDRTYDKKYGKLYNWYAVTDKRKLAPKGWHIPSENEWNVLTDFLGGGIIAGEKLSCTPEQEKEVNEGLNSGFSALPSGYRTLLGTSEQVGSCGYWWSASLDKSGLPFAVDIDFSRFYMLNKSFSSKGSGLSVRCLRD